MSNSTSTPKRVELWIRSFAPASAGPTQERALERLDDLEASAAVDSVEVGIWGKEVEVDGTERPMRIPQLRRIRTRLEAFETWAARTGRRLEPFFRNTRIESTITGESREVWRLPTIALAEFDGNDELLHVAPCRDGDRTIDALDRLETLVDGDADAPSPVDSPHRTDEVMTDRPSERTTDYGRTHVDLPSSRSD